MIAVLVASLMLTVPFSASTDSYAEEPMSDLGIYFETDSPLTNNADIITVIGEDGIDDIYEAVFDVIGIMNTNDITYDLLTELSIKKGALKGFSDNKVYDDTYEILSGKISGEYVNDVLYGNSIDFVGEDALDLYRYIGGEEKLHDGKFTLDLRFDVREYTYITEELIKVGDDYFPSKTVSDNYNYSRITGTVSFVPEGDPEVVKSFNIDNTFVMQGTTDAKVVYEVSDMANVTEDTVTYVGDSIRMDECRLDNIIEFDGKKGNFIPSEMILVTAVSNVPTIYDEDTAQRYDFYVDPTDYELESLLDTSDADAVTLKEKCDAVGTVGETYALASEKKPSIPSVEDDEGSNIPLYVGIGVGGLAVVGIAAFLLLRRRA